MFHFPRKYLLILSNYKKDKIGSQGKTTLWIWGGLDAFFEHLNPGAILDFRSSAAHGSISEKKEVLENLACYIIRASFSQEGMTYLPDESQIIHRSKDNR
jgi:hypothetical protein